MFLSAVRSGGHRAEADIEVVGDARERVRSTWRAVAIRVPRRSGSSSRGSSTISGFSSTDAAPWRRAHCSPSACPVRRSRPQTQRALASARAAHRHAPALRQFLRQRQRQRGFGVVPERHGVRSIFDVRPATAGETASDNLTAPVAGLNGEHRERIRDRLPAEYALHQRRLVVTTNAPVACCTAGRPDRTAAATDARVAGRRCRPDRDRCRRPG